MAVSAWLKQLRAEDAVAIEQALALRSGIDLQVQIGHTAILMRGKSSGAHRVEGLLLKLPPPRKVPPGTPIRARDEFVAAISHELRTPLNAILGFARLARADAPEGAERRHLDYIDQASRLMLRVVNDLLDLTRLEAGKLEIDPEQPLNMHAVVSRVGAVAASLRQDKPVRLYASVDAACPMRLRGDVGRIEQILLNLVANALKFTDRGRIVVDVRQRSRQTESVVLRISVSDTGAGIAMDQIARIGLPFEQANNPSLPQTGGTGLGLAVVNRLLELHGTSLKVASVAGGGSIFWFDIEFPFDDAIADVPLKPDTLVISEDERLIQTIATQWAVHGEALCHGEDAQSASRWVLDLASDRAHHMAGQGLAWGRQIFWVSAEPAVNTSEVCPLPLLAHAVFGGGSDERLELDPQLRGLKVLVVEDNALNQHVLREYLRRLGVDVTIVGEGRPVPALLGQRHVDLVLLDIQLPDWSGWDVARAVRALPNGSDMRIVFLSAHVDPSDQIEAAHLGALACLSKPFDAPQLHQILREVAQAARVTERRFEQAQVEDAANPVPTVRPKAALLGLFAAQWPSLRTQITGAEDAQALRRAVHALRGSLAVMGQAKLVERARQVEEALLAGRVITMDELQDWLVAVDRLVDF
ncbi:MAG: response regulator [Aquabacterium sp.]|uniref:ATP-binding protein n=1 Tax=Aquabacterium sp. TaxID=1872578 RepID=UPI0025BCDD81|nr:ATP-binding protein [Aquabacterium sp.]MBI5924079.1 response regulator [Aquabacterium sp.]